MSIDLAKLQPYVDKWRNVTGNLIVLLQKTQQLYGYIPQSAMEFIANNTQNSKAEIYGVATFYHQFRLQPIGKYLVMQCQGTACHVNDSKNIAEEIKTTIGDDTHLFTTEDVACLGCCSLAPVIMINSETHGNLTQKMARKIIKKIKIKETRNGD